MTPLAATEAERLERERFNKWSLGQFVLDRDEKSAWRAWLARAMQQTAEPAAWAVFAPDGNVRIWFGDIEAAKRWKARYEPTLSIELTPLYRAAPARAPSTDSAADACWNPTDKELVSMVEDMRDAARYRALRDIKTTGMPIVHPPFEPEQGYVRDGLDCAIDAAIAASLPQTKEEPKPHERRRFER